MANYRGRILETVRTHAKAHIDKHLMNVEVLIGSHVGVAEHPDIIEECIKIVDNLVAAKDSLNEVLKQIDRG